MRIQWSSEAVQEMLIRLEKADEGMENCILKTKLVFGALDEANADGKDRALQQAKERFETCTLRLERFSRDLGDFVQAIRKADELFVNAEKNIGQLMDDEDMTSGPLYGATRDADGYVRWETDAYMVMPGMRMYPGPIPTWLEKAAAGSSTVLL